MNRDSTENKNITDLADYTTLKKLCAALWQQDTAYHGAAVMVGAGFSRSAASTGDIKASLPLWYDLSSKLATELGANSNADPLRLAEEYCAYFGKQALHDLVKKEINDESWIPGELYKSLFKLPWSEVLTTNWDTLLERASKEIHQPVYSVVSRQEDLSRVRSPRIIKLHGTVNVTEELIFTQEDYRTYPQRYAAFVNFARQVFIENELCLLGFSGDDPNFLQWAGWVRDQLATNSRRIYLVGALNLTVAKRKYLESINIAPIDLSELVADYDNHDSKHLEATKIFLQTLQGFRPEQAWEWSPTKLSRSTITTEENSRTHKNPEYAASLLKNQLQQLKADRHSYPGWLVCPSMLRWELSSQISDPFPTAENLSKMDSDSRAKLLYEIAWRYSVTYRTVSEWHIAEFLKICDPHLACELTKKQQMEIALLLLKNARWNTSQESESIKETAISILEREAKHWPESTNELAYYRAIVARDRFDYPAIETHSQEIEGTDPVWKLRKASLLGEIGYFNEGKRLIAEAYQELIEQYRNNRNSIYILSRLAWAEWLLSHIDTWQPREKVNELHSVYQNSKCAPLGHIEHIQKKVSEALEKQRKQQEIEPSFEPGRYKDNSNLVMFNNEIHPILLMDGISNSVGMPPRWTDVSFTAHQAPKLAELEDVDFAHRFNIAIRCANSDSADELKKVISRTQIACLQQNEADYLLERCFEAINYWSSDKFERNGENWSFSIGRLRVFLEVLARISVRSTEEQAKKVYRLAIELGKKQRFHHHWLYDAFDHLITYALKSIPQTQHHELLKDSLSFPLSTEISIRIHERWPNPEIRFPGNRSQDTSLDRRIGEIIDNLEPNSTKNAPALIRLLPLLSSGFLTGDEQKRVAEKIWGGAPDYKELPETGLLKYVLLFLPSQNSRAVKALVRNYLFEASQDNLLDRGLLMDISNAAVGDGIKVYPNEKQASTYFERLVAWRNSQNDSDPFGFRNHNEKEKAELISNVLADSIIPSLPTEFLTAENFQKLYTFYSEVESTEASIKAFAYFAAAKNMHIERVEAILRQGMQAQHPNKVAHSAYALLKWRELQDSPATNRLILRLVHLIGSSRMTGLSALLGAATLMYNKDYLSKKDVESLIEILPVIFDNTDHRNISPSSREAVSASLVRAASVRLVRDILSKTKSKNSELHRVLEEARQDALPEVRFAETTDF